MSVVSVEIPPCHEAKSSPERWDAAFENALRITTAQAYLFSNALQDSMSPDKHQGKLEEYPELVRNLCNLQFRVSNLAFDAMIFNDLAAKWLGTPLDVRKKHVLIGIAGACGISPNLNQARLSCTKELRVPYLSTDGRILLKLINAIAPHDLSQEPVHPQYVNNDEWDEIQIAHQDSQDELMRLALAHILVLRNKLITHFVQFVICSFLGHDLPQIAIRKKAHSHNKTTPPPNPLELFHEKAMLAKYGKQKVDEISATCKTAYKERKANKVNVCRCCERQATTREIFKRCGACWKIDREVLYCSTECQRENWKQHKLMCGKPLDYDVAVKLATSPTTSNGASDIPPPANGFKPPLELRVQMRHLKNHPTFDYAVSRSVYTNGENLALMIYNGPVGPIFRKHRDNAINTGDHTSAALICDCVLWDIEVRKAPDFRREMVVDQFSREYQFPVAELERVLEEMAKFRASTHNRFPPLAVDNLGFQKCQLHHICECTSLY